MPVERIGVVGAGIVGASIAYHLACRGAKVTIFEAERPGAGASGKSFGWLNATFSKRPRAYYELSMLGMAGWHRLERELPGAFEAQWGGSVMWSAQADELRDGVRNHREWGYATRLISPGEMDTLLPGMSFGDVQAACFSEPEGALDAERAVRVLIEAAQKRGAELRQCEVTALDIADTVVLACGVDTPRLAALAGVRVPLKEAPGMLVHTEPLPQVTNRVVVAPDVHFRQGVDGRFVIGGQMVAGAGTAESAERRDGQQILATPARYVPELRDAAIERVTLGRRVMPEDEYPIVGFVRPNLYIAVMHSAVTLAPVIGELAALEILDGLRCPEFEPYRVERFTAG